MQTDAGLGGITMNKASGGDGIPAELLRIPKRWCCESVALNMPANLENSAVVTGLEKISFHSNPKERQCQRMFKLPHNCNHLTCQESNVPNSPSQASTEGEPRTSRLSSWIYKRQRNQRSNCQHPLDHRKSKRIPEKHHLLYWLYQSLWVCGSQQTVENSFSLVQSVQSFSCVQLLATPRIAAGQASLSIINSQSSLKLTSIELVMPSSHLILCRPLLLLPSIFPSIRVFSNESTLLMRWLKNWCFSFSIIPSKEHPGLISFRMDWLDLFAVQGTLKSLLQYHS